VVSICKSSAPRHKLYQQIKSQEGPDNAPTVLELEIIAGDCQLNDQQVVKYFANMPCSGETLGIALPVCACLHVVFLPSLTFELQAPFDKGKWQDYLVKFMVIANLPFSFAKLDEFCDFVHYTRGLGCPVHVPSASTVKRQVLSMAEKTIDDIRERLVVCACVQLLSLAGCTDCINRIIPARSASFWMHGPLQTDMHS
jgi:hypothetical protein